MLDVVALGELLIDFTCQTTDPEGYPTMQAHPGGAPANFLATLAKFGAKTAMIGKVGSDAFGKMLVNTLNRRGIDTSGMILSEDVFTTLAFVTLDQNGDRGFSFSRKPGADTCLEPGELNFDLLKNTKVFHFGALSLTDEPARSATQEAVRFAKAHGKLISFDPNLRKPLWNDPGEAKKQMFWGLRQADVVKISDEEVEFLFGLGAEEGGACILKEFGVKLVFVTCGADGCFFSNRQTHGWVKGLTGLTVVDTTGAGDIFGGSALWKLLQSGKDPETLSEEELRDITRFACTAAGLSTEHPGGISSIPELETVLARMA